MPIHVRVDEAQALVEVEFAGELTDSDFIETVTRYLREPFTTLPLGLFDLSGVTVMDVASASIREVARRAAEHVDSSLEEGKVAIVAPRDFLFGMARMYEILRDGSPVEVRVFRERGEAESWLGLTRRDAVPGE